MSWASFKTFASCVILKIKEINLKNKSWGRNDLFYSKYAPDPHTKKCIHNILIFFLSFFKKDLDGKFVGCEHT